MTTHNPQQVIDELKEETYEIEELEKIRLELINLAERAKEKGIGVHEYMIAAAQNLKWIEKKFLEELRGKRAKSESY